VTEPPALPPVFWGVELLLLFELPQPATAIAVIATASAAAHLHELPMLFLSLVLMRPSSLVDQFR
jgi:hypothetical protein